MITGRICLLGIVMILVGGLAAYRQRLHSGRYDGFVNGLSVALIACGIAVLRDGITGSRHILWMLPEVMAHAS